LSTNLPFGTGRTKGFIGKLPSACRGALRNDVSMLKKSFELTAGEITCQLLLIRVE
jgi:hypothetical protein